MELKEGWIIGCMWESLERVHNIGRKEKQRFFWDIALKSSLKKRNLEDKEWAMGNVSKTRNNRANARVSRRDNTIKFSGSNCKCCGIWKLFIHLTDIYWVTIKMC